MKISGAIFDMDGTLLDSMAKWESAASDFLMKKGLTPTERLLNAVRSMNVPEAAELICKECRLSESASQIADGIRSEIGDFYAYQVLPKAGALELLRQLQKAGVPMCVATATDRPLAEIALKRTGLLDFFAFLITGPEAGANKEKPDIFEQALLRLGTPKSSTYVFEDAPFALKTAKSAGFPTVGIYDASFACLDEIKKRYADCYVYAPIDLLGRFQPLKNRKETI